MPAWNAPKPIEDDVPQHLTLNVGLPSGSRAIPIASWSSSFLARLRPPAPHVSPSFFTAISCISSIW
jgi:hypothetical protein